MLRRRGLSAACSSSPQDACGDAAARARRPQDALPAGAARRRGVRPRRAGRVPAAARAARRPAPSVFGVDRWEARRRARDQAPAELRAAVRGGRHACSTRCSRAHRRSHDAFARELYLDDADDRARWPRAGMAFGYHTPIAPDAVAPVAGRAGATSCAAAWTWIRALTGQARCRSAIRGAARAPTRADTLGCWRDAGYRVAFNTVRRRVAVGARRPLRAAAARHPRPAAVHGTASRRRCPPWRPTTHERASCATAPDFQAYLRARDAVLRMKQAGARPGARGPERLLDARSSRTSTT